jgi:hypothetical protein
MQNRYSGDVGDFGKLGLLRQLESIQLKVGINWYLIPDETHNADGKHIGYLYNSRFDSCDDVLRETLKELVHHQRCVSALESSNLIPNAVYYHDLLYSSMYFSREDWHKKALILLKQSDIVFLDPDNGLLVKSVSIHSSKSNKYVLPTEITDYFKQGQSVVFYNHRSREPEDVYFERFSWMRESSVLKQAVIIVLTFRRGTIRDYICALQPNHSHRVLECLEDMLQGPWRDHFTKTEINN